ncbi:MAG: questin oxidase family protein [Acidobacteria bacterium]|nr:questin oxidase family protein [Acidobacteriota bacterium]
MDESTSFVLQELLGDELASDPTTVRGLTNHLPMALVAKQRLGASGDELRRFATAYSQRLAPLAAAKEHLDHVTWKTAVGNRGAATELRDYFAHYVANNGVDAALRAHLPALVPGVGGAGFHGVIRLAYAIEASSPIQIAAGLAYFASVARPLTVLAPTEGTTSDPGEHFAEMSTSLVWSTPQRARLIEEEMRFVAGREGFGEIVGSLVVDEESEEKLAACALQILASTDDFTALHGVTGLAALSVVRPWLEDQELVDRYAFQALTAAYLSIGAPPVWSSDRLDEFVGSTLAKPLEVRAVAGNSDDEHVAKLAYTAIGGFERTGDPLYLSVAARATAPSLSPNS